MARLRREIGKAFVGQGAVVDQLLVALLAGGHALFEGVPGVGKTLLVRALAKTFSGRFSRVQFTPDLMPSDITGHLIYDMKQERFRLHRGPVFTHLLLADEVNRAPAKTQSALLEVMQERQVSIEGRALPVPSPFMAVATQNPIEQEGTYPLPEAQLDRFLLKVLVDYPPEDEEAALVRLIAGRGSGETLDVSVVEEILDPERMTGLQRICAMLRLDPVVAGYAVRIVRATRRWAGIRYGAGPRGALALVRARRATALMAGRAFVLPDDVKQIAVAVLRHRLVLEPELELELRSADEVLYELLEHVEAPRN